MNEIIIRRAEMRDMDAMEALEKACFSDPWSRAEIESALDSPVNLWLCAFSGETLAGVLGVQAIAPEADILSVSVAPPFRRQGIARALLTRFFETAEEIDTVFLEVRRSNVPAQALYESMGFELFGMRKSYYENPVEDALLYSRSKPREELC